MTTPELHSDCSACFGLCCVLLPFSRESGFGATKPGGRPCLNLADDDSCRIHATLRDDGWPGCTVFECFGAGQQVSQVTYAGVSWRERDNLAEMGAVLTVMRALHEMLSHLTEAAGHGSTAAATWVSRLSEMTGGTPEELLEIDLDTLRADVGEVLTRLSASVRSRWPDAAWLVHADLAGRDLRGRDLRGAGLRGAVLIAADLRGLDLCDADLLGADVRDADVRDADLSDALFLTQPQLAAMRGNAATLISLQLARPAHWQ